MEKKSIYILSTLCFILLILCIRLDILSVLWLNNWGIYFFLVPALFCLSNALGREKNNLKLLISFSLGIIVTILLTRGNWIEKYAIQKIAATLTGTLISFIINHNS